MTSQPAPLPDEFRRTCTSYNAPQGFTFDNFTRVYDDGCGITARNVQNARFANYPVTNYFAQYCGMQQPIEFAMSQPGIFYKGGLGNSDAGGCDIDTDSMMRNGRVVTNPKCRISLQQRPFLTVPLLVRGPAQPVLESQLQQGEWINGKKSCDTITDTFFPQQYVPLIPIRATEIQDPHNLIQEIAMPGWIRSGIPSRQLVREGSGCYQ